MLLGVEAQVAPVRAPQQSADVHAPLGGRDQACRQGPAVIGQLLVRVASPVGEVDPVAGVHLRDPLVQVLEVRPAVNQRLQVIAGCPARSGARRGQSGVGILALLKGQEPVGNGHGHIVQHGSLLRETPPRHRGAVAPAPSS